MTRYQAESLYIWYSNVAKDFDNDPRYYRLYAILLCSRNYIYHTYYIPDAAMAQEHIKTARQVLPTLSELEKARLYEIDELRDNYQLSNN